MKKKLIMIATLALAICNIIKAEDKVTINDFRLYPGDTKEVCITLSNEASYVAFQFDLYLPDGIVLESYNANTDRIPKTTTLNMSQQSDGAYRFLSAAMSGDAIVGNSGVIVALKVKASEEMEYGEMKGYFRKVKLSKADATGPTYEEMSFPITVLEPTVVRVTSVSREYGEENPTFEYTVSGEPIDGTPELTCRAKPTSPVGRYRIFIDRGSVTNEKVTFVGGYLTVNKAPLTVTANSYTIKQGEELPTFEAVYSGFKNDETSSVLDKQPTFTCSATSLSAPGTYDITVSDAEAANYDINYVNGTLTVEVGTYTLTYIVDGEVYKTVSYDYGDTIIPEAEPTKEGYTFSGWSELPETMPAHDVTVTASFTLGISTIQMDSQKVRIFDTKGNQIGKLKKGVNIIRPKAGKTKKVILQVDDRGR